MTTKGFAESQTAFISTDTQQFIGQVRRFGPYGPAYEVIDMTASQEAVITVIESGEQLAYPLADMIADPVAETIP